MSQSDFRAAVRVTPVESTLGIILTVAGAILAIVQGDVWLRIIGTTIATCGTVLLSWALTRAWVAKQQSAELARSLQTIARPLGTVATQLSYAVLEADQDDESPVDRDLVRLNVQHLYGVLSDIQALIGSPLGVDEVLAIKGKLDMLGRKLAEAESLPEPGPNVAGSTRSILKEAAEEVDNLTRQIQRTYTTTPVQCPVCRAATNAVMGDLPGDSAIATCGLCGSRFHAHRAGDGSPMTRPWGTTKQPRIGVRPPCPECGEEAPFNVTPGMTGAAVRYCLHCYAKLSLDPTTRVVSTLRGGTPPTEGLLSSNNAVIVCPICVRPRRSYYNRDGRFFASCTQDDVLLIAQKPDAAGLSDAAT